MRLLDREESEGSAGLGLCLAERLGYPGGWTAKFIAPRKPLSHITQE